MTGFEVGSFRLWKKGRTIVLQCVIYNIFEKYQKFDIRIIVVLTWISEYLNFLKKSV